MDYIRRCTLLNVAVSLFIVSSSSHALLDTSLEESFMFPHQSSSEDESQMTSCDFESPCSWTFSNHSIRNDWKIVSPEQRPHRSSTPAVRPVSDHSQGTSDGHFLLWSPSAASRSSRQCEYDIASPVVYSSGPLCRLQLARFESGLGAGNLSVSVKPVNSESVISTSALKIVAQDGVRAQWEVLEAVIGEVGAPYQVILLYTTCLGRDRDHLVLDSLELIDCDTDHRDSELDTECDESTSFHCDIGGCVDKTSVCDLHSDCPLGEDEGIICDSMPHGALCSFELGSCGWSTSNELPAWKRVSGEELRHGDRTLGSALQNTQGFFLFLAVRENGSSHEASVQSSSFPRPVSTTACQLHFSLYRCGDFNGTLVLSLEEDGSTLSPLVWEKSGRWKDHWQEVTLQLPALLNGFHLKVKALWGPGSYADIALDNIALGASCFETDLNSLLLGHRLFHEMDSISEQDFFGPLPEPSASDVSLMTWVFTSCGASGPRGPTQAQCDSSYRNTNVSVVVAKDGPLRGVQMWRVPASDRYMISAYGAAGGKGAKNNNKRSHGVFISAIFPLERGDVLYILVGQQGEDACPGRNPLTRKICLGESFVIEEKPTGDLWAGGGGGGGGATFIYKMDDDQPVPLLIAAGGGGKAYLEDPDQSGQDQDPLEQYENSTVASSSNGRTGGAGGGGGWKDTSSLPWAGKSLLEGAEGGSSCPQALSNLSWATSGGFGGGGGACSAGGGGGGYRGGDSALTDDITAGGQDGISFIHPMGEIFLQPLAAMESHGDCEIKVQLNCSHCRTQSCKQDKDSRHILCQCHHEEVLASDNVTCTAPALPQGLAPDSQPSLSVILVVVASTVVMGIVLTCASLTLSKRLFQFCVDSVPSTFHRLLASRQRAPLTSTHRPPGLPPRAPPSPAPNADYQPASGPRVACTEVYYRKKNQPHAVRLHLQSPEYKLSKIRSSTIMTDYNPNYCFAGKAASLSELKEVPRKNITLLRALGHGAFGEVYEGQVLGMNRENTAMHVAIKTLPEICSEQDEMDFLMEALIMSKFSHGNIVRCIGVSLQMLPRFILLELMTGGDMKSFLRQNRPKTSQSSSLTMLELLHMARDIAFGCRYLEENHFIHRDIAARNCLLTCVGPDRVAKIGDFGMARDIYRASYYRKGGRAMLPVKWMPPEAFMEGIFTCKTDTWSFGVLLWEIFSLGYLPYPCRTNQEVLEFVTSGGRMDPPNSCPGPVYRIMTQCWQHCPEHRPNFSTILERINYCTQDPDVINTALPVEYGPTVEEDLSRVIRPDTPGRLSPLLGASQALSLAPTPHLQPHKPCLLLQRPQQPPQEEASHREALEPPAAAPVPAPGPGSRPGAWLHPEPHHKPCSRNGSFSGSQRLKNKTKNLWNPTYGSWVLDSFGRGMTALSHTQSMPLSTHQADAPTPESGIVAFSTPSPSCQPQSCPPSQGVPGLSPSHKDPAGGASGSPSLSMDLAKLQSFPCGKVNYAYDERSYESERPVPLLVVSKAPEPKVPAGCAPGVGASRASACMPKLLLKRHASYGHEDVRRHAKPQNSIRDRDSGFSLSEDLSVTPV
ncbi:hypothetical protein DPEC_G00314470 [Dallia pectoralis]|uniref:Uncharacterized protein n=1 Tax=Dallia pectoralis TaxID=75939 RepID=A0ACC2FCB7_DALPE|nr:hypothetical protein DPEC_G00314470 [Dallia pectoralis]